MGNDYFDCDVCGDWTIDCLSNVYCAGCRIVACETYCKPGLEKIGWCKLSPDELERRRGQAQANSKKRYFRVMAELTSSTTEAKEPAKPPVVAATKSDNDNKEDDEDDEDDSWYCNNCARPVVPEYNLVTNEEIIDFLCEKTRMTKEEVENIIFRQKVLKDIRREDNQARSKRKQTRSLKPTRSSKRIRSRKGTR